MVFNPTWNFNPGKAKVQYPDMLGRRERHRQHASENLDDVISYCAGLRGFADSIQKKAATMDKRRREGKAWESGTVSKEIAKLQNMLTKLQAAAAALEGGANAS